MDKNNMKKDIAYIGASICFMILLVVRFWDRQIQDTNHLLEQMNVLRIGEIITVVFFISMIIYMFFTLKRNEGTVKKSVYYLLALLMVLLIPIYLCDNYFGTGDVYSWVLILFAIISTVAIDMDFIAVILILGALAVCPMHNLAGIFAVFIILLYKAIVQKKKASTVWFVVGAVLYIAGFIGLYMTHHISGVNIHRITLTKFIVSLVLLSPIILFVLKFLWDMIKAGKSEEKILYTAIILGGVVNFAMLTIMGDYCRAVVLTTAYFVVVCLSLLSLQDQNFLVQYNKAREIIIDKIPVPVAIIIYVFAIVTYWYFAMDEIDPDVFIEFNINM